MNALDENPVFHTYRLSHDPVQIGSICLNSGDCRDIGGSNRNLLDFNDLTIDLEGRVYIAFADGCIDACATGNNSQPEDSRTGRGSVYFMATGPCLYVENGQMASPVYLSLQNVDASTFSDVCQAESCRSNQRKAE